MVKDIVKDTEVLSQQSRSFDKKTDVQVITDLIDTANAHFDNCLGLSAIQIGEAVKCFVVKTKQDTFKVYINPTIIKKSTQTYKAEEGCLSLDGTREVKRYDWIDVIYSNENGKYIKEHLTGLTAEIFQHEYDHLFGKLI